MKRIILSVLGIVFASSVAFAVVGGGDVVYKVKNVGDVTFSHDSHATDRGFKCENCHPTIFPAALIMATFRAALRTEMRRQADLRAVAARLNDAVLEFRDAARFVTAVCCVLDAASGSLSYVNCGHNPPLLLHGTGAREMLHHGGSALGLFAGASFEAGAAELEPGDTLVLYTDGVVEPANPADAEFGVEQLEAAVRAAGGLPASEALRTVIDATRAFSGRDGYEDDFTLVVLRRLLSYCGGA